MKKILENLLIVISLGLCALILFQWQRESRLRHSVEEMSRSIYSRNENIQNLQGVVKRGDEENARLESIRARLADTVRTNTAEIIDLKKDRERLEREIDVHTNNLARYKEAVEVANASIQQQNESIKQQNDIIKQLGEERTEMVQKFNKVVEQYNDLVKQFETYQKDATTALSNATATAQGSRSKESRQGSSGGR